MDNATGHAVYRLLKQAHEKANPTDPVSSATFIANEDGTSKAYMLLVADLDLELSDLTSQLVKLIAANLERILYLDNWQDNRYYHDRARLDFLTTLIEEAVTECLYRYDRNGSGEENGENENSLADLEIPDDLLERL